MDILTKINITILVAASLSFIAGALFEPYTKRCEAAMTISALLGCLWLLMTGGMILWAVWS